MHPDAFGRAGADAKPRFRQTSSRADSGMWLLAHGNRTTAASAVRNRSRQQGREGEGTPGKWTTKHIGDTRRSRCHLSGGGRSCGNVPPRTSVQVPTKPVPRQESSRRHGSPSTRSLHLNTGEAPRETPYPRGRKREDSPYERVRRGAFDVERRGWRQDSRGTEGPRA